MKRVQVSRLRAFLRQCFPKRRRKAIEPRHDADAGPFGVHLQDAEGNSLHVLYRKTPPADVIRHSQPPY